MRQLIQESMKLVGKWRCFVMALWRLRRTSRGIHRSPWHELLIFGMVPALVRGQAGLVVSALVLICRGSPDWVACVVKLAHALSSMLKVSRRWLRTASVTRATRAGFSSIVSLTSSPAIPHPRVREAPTKHRQTPCCDPRLDRTQSLQRPYRIHEHQDPTPDPHRVRLHFT